jgi:hypothetical protein
MSRKQREQKRELQRKERKRERGDAKSRTADEMAADAVNEQAAATIIEQLGETEEEPIGTIQRAVSLLGAEPMLALLEETLQIEAQGGMWLRDGSRRRTVGGVFFKLLQERITKSQRLSIFYPEYEQVFPLSEEELTERLQNVEEWPIAEAQAVSCTLLGRPAVIPPPDVHPDTPYVLFELSTGTEQIPTFTKGLPPFSEPVVFRVVAPTAQWLRVAPVLIEQADTRLAITGFLSLDPRSTDRFVLRAHNSKGQHARRRSAKNANRPSMRSSQARSNGLASIKDLASSPPIRAAMCLCINRRSRPTKPRLLLEIGSILAFGRAAKAPRRTMCIWAHRLRRQHRYAPRSSLMHPLFRRRYASN